MNIIYHYPPELFNLLVDTIPRLCRSKQDVIIFFRGAGVDSTMLNDISLQLKADKASINKFEIARTVIERLNQKGETTLRERREVLKRITEFEDFSTCWPNDQLKAKGLVAEIRRVINVKDSFTRINAEREQERHRRVLEQERKIAEVQARKAAIEQLRQDWYPWFGKFGEQNRQQRGKALEDIVNRLFRLYGISVLEAFQVILEEGAGVVEQIDGAIELTGNLYLVEVKWLADPVDVNHVSRHCMRLFARGDARGIVISASGVTAGALQVCRDALKEKVVFIITLDELVQLLDSEGDLTAFLKMKEQAAIAARNPYQRL